MKKTPLFAFILVLLVSAQAKSVNVVVNMTTDVSYPQGNGLISLRNAFATANSSTTPTTITFDPTVFASAQTIVLRPGDFNPADDMRLSNTTYPTTISGPAAGVTVSGTLYINANVTAILANINISGGIDNSGTVTLNNLTVSGDIGDDVIYNSGTATLTNVIISGIVGSQRGFNNQGTATLNNVTISGSNDGAMINSGTATLNNVIISGNDSGFFEGGIYNEGMATLANVTISNNNGGGIYNYAGGTAILNNVTISNNTAGSGIENDGTMTLTDVTISNNTNDLEMFNTFEGGGVYNDGTATLTNVTISGNTAPGGSSSSTYGGGGIYNDTDGTVTLTNVTISGNTVPGGSGTGSGGGGISNFAPAGNFTIANSIIAGNTADNLGPDVYGSFTSLGYNFIGKTDNGSGWNGTDRTGTIAFPLNPKLGSLADNGGPTLTMALLLGSPAIDAGSNALIPSVLKTDQRGLPRIVNGTVDIGACEYQPVVTPPSNISISSANFSYSVGSAITITGIVKDSDGNPLPGVGIGTDDSIKAQCLGTVTTTGSDGSFSISYTAADTQNAGAGEFPVTLYTGSVRYTIVINLYDPTQAGYQIPNMSLMYGPIGDADLLNDDTLVCSRKPSTWTGSLPTVQQKSDVGMKIARGLGEFGWRFLMDDAKDPTVDAAALLWIACPFTDVTCVPAAALTPKALKDLAQNGLFDGAHAAVDQIYTSDPTTAANVNTFLDGANLAVSAATLDPDKGIISLIDTVDFAEQAEQYAVEVDPLPTGEINEVRVVTVGHNTGKTLISVFHRTSTVATSTILITKCTVTAGSKDNSDAISFSGTMDTTTNEISAASTIEVTISSADILSPCVKTFPINGKTFKKGKFNCSASNASFALDTKTTKFSFTAKNIDLSGLSCPLTVQIKIGDSIGTKQVDEDVINGKTPIPINLLMGVKDSLRVDGKPKFTKKSGVITQVAISGSFSDKNVNDVSLLTNPLDITIGSQTFTIPAHNFKNTKGKFICSKVDTSKGIAAATFDFNKCTFTLTIKNTNFAASVGNTVFGIDFASFSESDLVTLP